MRSPSIHISKSNLRIILEQELEYSGGHIPNLDDVVDNLLIRAKQYSLTHRNIVVDKAKLLKSTSKIVLSTRNAASVFANLLLLIRKQKKHRGISIIKVGSRDWGMVKEITKLALDFCKDFELNREEGFKMYIEMALPKMNKFSLMKFNSLHQSICEDYAAIQEIKSDLTPRLTEEARIHYEKLLGEKGIVRDYSKSPDKYIYFIKVKDECKKYSVKIRDYIKSQFSELEWANAIPDPAQLVGPKAIDRLNRFLVKNNIKPKESSVNIDKLANELKSRMKNQ